MKGPLCPTWGVGQPLKLIDQQLGKKIGTTPLLMQSLHSNPWGITQSPEQMVNVEQMSLPSLGHDGAVKSVHGLYTVENGLSGN
jgi:hypothetical protein